MKINIGDSVEVTSGSFKGKKGKVKDIALGRGAKPEASIKGSGRSLEFLVPITQLKKI